MWVADASTDDACSTITTLVGVKKETGPFMNYKYST